MLKFKNDRAYCSLCENYLTIFSENGGKGFRARCSECKVTYFYPICEECDQPVWKHDEDKHEAVKADKAGKRYCRKCKKVKELSDFNMNGNTMSARCKTCQAEYFQQWYRGSRTATKSESDKMDDVLDDLFGEM